MSDDAQKDPKDGYDLLEFPCNFAFKAVCRRQQNAQAPVDIVRGLVVELVPGAEIKSVRSSQSRGGKFESVTITVWVLDRQMLETIYHGFADSDQIVMTL